MTLTLFHVLPVEKKNGVKKKGGDHFTTAGESLNQRSIIDKKALTNILFLNRKNDSFFGLD